MNSLIEPSLNVMGWHFDYLVWEEPNRPKECTYGLYDGFKRSEVTCLLLSLLFTMNVNTLYFTPDFLEMN